MADVLIRGWFPSGPLTPEDMLKIDLEVPFEISDGKLEIMTPPSIWHQSATRRVERLLQQKYPYATGDVPVTVGNNGRRPDVVAVMTTEDELLRLRIRGLTADMVEVAVEVISHDADSWKDSVAVGRDRDVKSAEYAKAGIPEYWIVDEIADDPTDASVEIYHLRGERYAPALLARLSQLLSGEVALPEHTR